MTEETPEQAPSTPNGRFVWHDLMSTDPAAAKAFYGALFGWTFEETEFTGVGAMHLMRVGDETVGGVMPLSAEQGVPSHWVGYVQVADLDATVGKVTEAGGQVLAPSIDCPEIGRWSVIRDPSGAVISPFQSAHGVIPDPDADSLKPGMFCWDELLTSDPEKCGGFYANIFDWRQESMAMSAPDGGGMTYHIFKRTNQQDGAGMMQMPAEAKAPSHWLPYVAVDDVDASLERATELGAQVYCAPTDIPNVGRFAVLADPTGASFAVFKGEQPTDCS